VSYNDKAYLIVGPTKSGKSTIITKLCGIGFEYLSDDIIPIHKKKFLITSFPKPIFIRTIKPVINFIKKSDYIKMFSNKIEFRKKNQKRYILMPNNYTKVTEFKKIGTIILLNRKKRSRCTLKPITGKNKFQCIMFNSYNSHNIKENYHIAASISRKFRFYELIYSGNNDGLKKIKKLILT